MRVQLHCYREMCDRRVKLSGPRGVATSSEAERAGTPLWDAINGQVRKSDILCLDDIPCCVPFNLRPGPALISEVTKSDKVSIFGSLYF